MRISDWSSDVCSSDLDAAPDFENAGIPGLAQSIERPCILDVFQPVESLERESSKLHEQERVIERAPVFGLSNDIEQNQTSVRMLGRSERARNEQALALGPWMIWTARLTLRTPPPGAHHARPIATGATQNPRPDH